MKKKFTILLLLFSLFGNAQSVIVTYSEKPINFQERLDKMPPDVREATLAEMRIPKLFTLEYSEGVSFYQREKNAKDFEYKSENTYVDKNGETINSTLIADKKLTPFFYYKDFAANLMLFKLTNSNLNFDGKDSLIPWNWEISDETKTINGYKCKKAISKAFDAYFEAWFTEDIPIGAGPEKFDGLPGLILYVRNLGQEYTAEKIEIIVNKIDIGKPKIPSKTVTFYEMIDQASEKFKKDTQLRNKKSDGMFIRTETY